MEGGEKEDKVVYRDLCYKLMGVIFEVFNDLGYGYQEKYYQKALETALKKVNINFKSQSPFKIQYKNEIIGRCFVDFIIEDKIVLEIKKGNYYSKKNFEQVNAYLKVTGFKLAILANFTQDGIKFKRLLNIK